MVNLTDNLDLFNFYSFGKMDGGHHAVLQFITAAAQLVSLLQFVGYFTLLMARSGAHLL